MTRLIGISMSGQGGWRKWLNTTTGIDNMLAKVDRLISSGKYHGVYLRGVCGWLPSTYAGRYATGKPVYTNVAGYSESPMHDVVAEFAASWETHAFLGLPRTLIGLDEMEDDLKRWAVHDKLRLGLDATGANMSRMVPATVRVCGDIPVRPESRPYPGVDPAIPGLDFYTMASRARECLRGGVELAGDIIVYNGGTDRNRWIEPEALVFENHGNVVVEPMGAIEQSQDGGTV